MAKLKKVQEKKTFKDKILEKHAIQHLIKFIKNMGEDNISTYAGEAALFTIISFFPFLMLFFVIVSFTSVTPAFIFRLINGSFPSEIIELFLTVIDQLNNTSTTVITITTFTALWSSSRGFLAINKGLNEIYKVPDKKNFIIYRLYGILYTLGFAVLLTLSLGLLGFGNSIYIWIVDHFPAITNLALLIMGMRASVLLALLFFFFLIMYIVVPHRKSGFLYELPGALLSSLGWIGFSYGFSFYIDHIANFSYVYGSLTAIVLLLLWVYACMYILFIGAELNKYIYVYLHEKFKVKEYNSRLLRLRRFIKKYDLRVKNPRKFKLLKRKQNNSNNDKNKKPEDN